jgi:hypothetical protein
VLKFAGIGSLADVVTTNGERAVELILSEDSTVVVDIEVLPSLEINVVGDKSNSTVS